MNFFGIINIVKIILLVSIFGFIFYFYFSYNKLKENNIKLQKENAILLVEKKEYENLKKIQENYIKKINFLNNENYKKDILIKEKFNDKKVICNVPEFKKEYNKIKKQHEN